MTPPINIDGTTENYSNVTIDGQTVEQITIDGQDVLNPIPDSGDLQARYDTRELSLSDSDPVATYTDETGNGNDLTQSTGSKQPTYVNSVINGNPVVRFDPSNSTFLDVAFSEISQPFQIFMVVKKQALQSATDQFAFSNDSGGSVIGLRETSSADWRAFFGNDLILSTRDTDAHVWNILADGGNSKVRIDGALDVSGTGGTDGLNGLTLGANNADGSHGDWDYGEKLIYPSNKTAVEADIESYLANGWGVTL